MVAEAVRKLDTRVLSSAEEARAIMACAPAPEERKMFEAFLHSGGKPEALSAAERFCLELMQVRNACHCLFVCLPCIKSALKTAVAQVEAPNG